MPTENYQVEVIKQGAILTKLFCTATDAANAIRQIEKRLNLSPKPVLFKPGEMVEWTGYEFVARRYG